MIHQYHMIFLVIDNCKFKQNNQPLLYFGLVLKSIKVSAYVREKITNYTPLSPYANDI